jgi:hypothetical protein
MVSRVDAITNWSVQEMNIDGKTSSKVTKDKILTDR